MDNKIFNSLFESILGYLSSKYRLTPLDPDKISNNIGHYIEGYQITFGQGIVEKKSAC
jgi:hypothetical protein